MHNEYIVLLSEGNCNTTSFGSVKFGKILKEILLLPILSRCTFPFINEILLTPNLSVLGWGNNSWGFVKTIVSLINDFGWHTQLGDDRDDGSNWDVTSICMQQINFKFEHIYLLGKFINTKKFKLINYDCYEIWLIILYNY